MVIMKAQGSLEYLIIIAAVLAIGAISVLFITGAFKASSGGADVSKCRVAASNCQRDSTLAMGSGCSYCGDSCKDSAGNDILDGSVGCGLGCLLCKKGMNVVSYSPMSLRG